MYNKDQYNITRHEKKNHNLEHVLHNRLVLCLASRRVWLSRSFLCISYVSFLPLEQRHTTFPFQNPLCTHKYGTDFCFSFLDHLPFLVFSFFFLASDSTQHSDETHAVSCTPSRSDAQRLLVAGKQFFFPHRSETSARQALRTTRVEAFLRERDSLHTLHEIVHHCCRVSCVSI